MQFYQNPFIFFYYMPKEILKQLMQFFRVKLLQNIEYQNSSINLEVSGL